MHLTLSPDLFRISATSSLMTPLPLHIVNSMLLASTISFRPPLHYSCLNASSLFFSSTPIRVDVHGHKKKMVRNISHLKNQGQGRGFSWRQVWDSEECLMKLGTWQDWVTQALCWRKSDFKSGTDRGDPDNDPEWFYISAVYLHWMAIDCTMSFFKVQGLGRQKLYLCFRKNCVQYVTYQEQLYP